MTAEPFPDVTLVITSCGRHDLLRRTLASMEPWLARFPNRILVEDGPGEEAELARLREEGFTVLVNGRTLGQHAAVDRAYAEVRTPLIFHGEDDWEFLREPDIATAAAILEDGIDGHRNVSGVCFRDFTDQPGFRQETYRETVINGSRYRYSFEQRSQFNAFTFNPCLLRRDLVEVTGPYAAFKTEGRIARFLHRRAYVVVTELPGAVRHIGEGRHVPRRPTTLTARWKRLLGREV